MLISNNDNNAHDLLGHPSTPDTYPTHDYEGTDPTHGEDLNVHHNNIGTYSISISN